MGQCVWIFISSEFCFIWIMMARQRGVETEFTSTSKVFKSFHPPCAVQHARFPATCCGSGMFSLDDLVNKHVTPSWGSQNIPVLHSQTTVQKREHRRHHILKTEPETEGRCFIRQKMTEGSARTTSPDNISSISSFLSFQDSSCASLDFLTC